MNPFLSLRSICILIAIVLILDVFWAPKSAVAEETKLNAGTYASQTIFSAAGRSGLLFVSRDSALAFYEATSGQIQKLTEPYTGKEFSVSPNGRTILFGNQIIALQSSASGDVSVSTATRPQDLFKLNWSPDGKEYGYVKRDGSTWIEDLPGNIQHLYKSDSPPGWSFDGRWMAYCDLRGRLWIAKTGKPADWIARQGSCTVNWSPKKPILAYVMYPAASSEHPVDGIAYLYNPITGRTKEIARSVSRLDWSPNGKLVSITRSLSSVPDNSSYSVTIANPETGQEQFLDQYSPEMNQNPTWIEQEDGYLFGRYRFDSELLTKELIADNLIDATQDGGKFLVSSEDDAALDVLCQDEEANRIFPLLHILRKDAYRVSPDGHFSPDGNWIWIRVFAGGKDIYQLARCDSSVPSLLPGVKQGADPYFSTDSSWLVIEQTHAVRDELAYIAILDLSSGQIKEIPAGLDTHSIWFQMPGLPVSPALSISSAALPSRSTGKTTATNTNPIELQIGGPKGNRPLVFLSLFLWASALVVILIVVIYRWKYPRK